MSARKGNLLLLLFAAVFLDLLQLGFSSTEGYLYVSNGSHILNLPLNGGQPKVAYHEAISRAVGLALDIRNDLLFWSDIGPSHEGIYMVSLKGTNTPRRIVKDVGKVNGLAVDWVSKHIYWTDESRMTLEVSSYEGENRRVLVDTGLVAPRGVAVDPVNSFVFIGDQGAKKIERFRLDGSERTVIVDSGLRWPNQLAINYYDGRLYWVDAYTKSIESSAIDGSTRQVVRSLSETHYAAPLFGLAMVNHTAYVSTWYDGAVYAADLATSGQEHVITEADYLTDHEMFSLAAHDLQSQPQQSAVCGMPSNGGCSHLCLMTDRVRHMCACPTEGVLFLAADGLTCSEPQEILLYADKDKGQLRALTLDGESGTHPLTEEDARETRVIASSAMPVAIGYDPIMKHVYWSDVRHRAIYRVNLDGTNKTVFLNASQGIGTVDGLFVDWTYRRLYFANMGYSSPKLDGAVYSWHRIELIGLDGRNRKSVVSNVGKPRGLAVDMSNGHIYYSDWGATPRVIRSDLDGRNAVTLMTSENVSNPNGLSVKEGKLYVTDSNYNHRLRNPQISVMDLNGDTFTVHSTSSMKIPYGIDVGGNKIYYSDWWSTDQHTGAILVYDVTTGNTTKLVSGLSNPAGIVYIKLNDEKYTQDISRCHGNSCSHICVATPKQETSKFRCLCPDLTGLSLDTTMTKCQVAENFILFTDLNTIRYIPLDGVHDQSVYTLHYGNYEANFVALAYDPVANYVYWSDLTSHSILRAKMTSVTEVETFYAADMAVDGMAIDPVGRRIYMTGYTVVTGVLASMSIDQPPEFTYAELLTGLDMPRAIALDLKNSYVYWTEYGKTSGSAKVGRAYLDGTDNRTLYDLDLRWPNALAVSAGQLYLADGSHRRIDIFSVDGARQGELAYMTGIMDHVFGLAVYENALYYTDWYSNSTSVVNLKTGRRDTLANNLYRPSAIVVHHPMDLNVHNACSSDEGKKCSDTCIPIPGGYHCSCHPGSQLGDDMHTCLIGDNVWQVTNAFRCDETCAESAYCARMLSTLHYQCVCAEGQEGDGVDECKPCPVDSYKPGTGNETCLTCPEGATTLGMTGSATCTCKEELKSFQGGECKILQTEDSEADSDDKVYTTAMPDESDYDDSWGYGYDDDDDIAYNDTSYGDDEEPIREGVTTTITYSLHHPVFENCPMDHVVRLVLPKGNTEVFLDIPLYAHDYLGQNIPIMGSHDIPPGARFHFTGPQEIQEVHYVAKDEFSQETRCQFSVIVEDEEAPTFTHCPGDISMETTKTTEAIYWEEPEVHDNINLEAVAPPTQESGSAFPVGKSEISYKAMDTSNNTAWCNFTIHITAIKVSCERIDVPEPRNGGLVCGENLHGFLCRTFCNPEKYQLNPLTQYHAVQCSHEGVWHQRFPADYVTKACLRTSQDRQVERHLQFWFTGPCDPIDHVQHKSIISSFVRLLQEQGLCGAAAKGHKSANTCDPNDFKVHCGSGFEESLRQRIRREIPNNVNIHMKIEATASLAGNLSTVERLVNETASRIETSLEDGASFKALGKTYYSRKGWVTLEPVQLTCQPGTVTIDDHCLLCPVGTYSDLVQSRCSDCQAGLFQDQEGQAICVPCPDGTKSSVGAYNISQCVATYQHRGRPLSANSALILGVLLAFFIVIGAVVIIIIVHRFHIARRIQNGGKRRSSNHDAAYIIQVQGRKKAHGDHDNDIDEETCHLRKREDSDTDDCSDDEKSETRSVVSKSSSGKPHFKDSAKRKRKSSKEPRSKIYKAKSKEEICLEVKTFMFDDDKKPSLHS